jgi:orotidine-5'-phosphate decarboxylase
MAQNPIYCALDTPNAAAAVTLAEQIGPFVGGLKLGMEFFYACGAAGARAVATASAKPIFIDLKLHDIPNTVAGGLGSLLDLEPAILNVHAQGGQAMMEAAAKAVRGAGSQAKIIAVTVLTSLDASDLAAIGAPATPADLVPKLALLAREAGLDGVVCSAHEVAALKALWPDGFFVVPGIRPAGSDAGDQKRVMTPAQALAAGASALVIGRPITAAADPATAARVIAESIGHGA